jgi:hypothetical protein
MALAALVSVCLAGLLSNQLRLLVAGLPLALVAGRQSMNTTESHGGQDE